MVRPEPPTLHLEGDQVVRGDPERVERGRAPIEDAGPRLGRPPR